MLFEWLSFEIKFYLMIGLASLRRLGFPTNSTVYKRFNSSINQQAVKPQISQHPRFTAKWWWDQTVVMGVFAVTGSSSMAITRPILRFFDIQGLSKLKQINSSKVGGWMDRGNGVLHL